VSISDLAAHHRYRVRLLASREANSLLMPYFETFSFIADPNSYKPIAVPFYASGVIEGSVLRQIGTEQRPVLGLRLLVQGSDSTAVSVPVFGDGTFYHFGLRPGRYEVRIDPQQLAALGLAATPEVRSIALRPGREGDVVRSLNFVLTPAEEHVRQGR
jgi:hypothetical protein